MAWVLLDDDNVVIRKQVDAEEGLIEASDNVVCGQIYTDGLFVDPTLTDEQKLANLRFERNSLLLETDWWANSDLTMTQEQIDYRQALRDITNTYSDTDSVVWPVKP